METRKENNSLLNSLLDQAEITQTEIVPRFVHDHLDEAKKIAQTCKGFYTLFQPALNKVAAFPLLQLVAYGNKSQVEEIVKRHPFLLLEKATVTDYSGQKIQGTAWQIAAGAEDVSINKQDDKTAEEIQQTEEMLEMIERYLRTLPDGELELAKQKVEQFPEGWEEIENERAIKDYAALKKVFEAIGASNTNQDCEAAIDEFRQYLQPKDIITTGKHFNVQLLAHFFRLYAENYMDFEGWYSRKNSLAWRNVGGEIQAHLPACYAQALCDGVYNVAEVKKPLSRSLALSNGMHFYLRDVQSKTGLGFGFAIYSAVGTAIDTFFAGPHRGIVLPAGLPFLLPGSVSFLSDFGKLCTARAGALNEVLKSGHNPEKKQRTAVIR